MAHGAGGKATPEHDRGPVRARVRRAGGLGDAATLEVDGAELALTTDSFVVKPIRFPGGSIGDLAVNGTVNDLAVSGARPLALSLSLILEEGLGADELAPRSRRSPRAAAAAGVADRRRRHQGRRARRRRPAVRLHDRRRAGATRARAWPPTRSGPATASCSPARSASTAPRSCWPAASSSWTPTIESDTRSLWPVADALLEEAGPSLRCMRDATRGGVASVLNELARTSQVAMLVSEAAVPIDPAVAGASEILGSTRCTWPTRASSSPSLPQEAADAALERAALGPGLRARGGDR